MKTQKDEIKKVKAAVAPEVKKATSADVKAKVAKMEKTIEASKKDETVLSPAQKEIAAKVEAAKKGETYVAPTKKSTKKTATKVTGTAASSFEEDMDLMASEVAAAPATPKKREPRGGLSGKATGKKDVKGSVPSEKSGKPWGKFGKHGQNVELEGFKKGDAVKFKLKNAEVVGEFSHFHINNHSPKGYLVMKYEGKIFERVLDKVSKVEPAVAETATKATKATKKTTAVKA